MQSEGVPAPVQTRPDYCLILLDAACEAQLEELLHTLRTRGVRAMRAEGSRQLAKQMRAASRLGAAVAVFIGGDEWAAGEVLIKDMASGEQMAHRLAQNTDINTLADFLIARAGAHI
jgi:histidyl-tRNA synthetase